jgi:ABC-type uncharacterized transport system permease subunit
VNLDRGLGRDIAEGILIGALMAVVFQFVHGATWTQWLVIAPAGIVLGVIVGLSIHWARESAN